MQRLPTFGVPSVNVLYYTLGIMDPSHCQLSIYLFGGKSLSLLVHTLLHLRFRPFTIIERLYALASWKPSRSRTVRAPTRR
jgi:hypothetical protein